jgi:CDP-diacylglycerol--serine O-phosphatidyltransferase
MFQQIIRHLPNAITLVNLVMGCIGLVLLFQNQVGVALCVGIALLADFLDGFVAKLLKATSAIGKQLDSLSDMVSFGVLPGAILYSLFDNHVLRFFALLLPIGAALRLAKFNIDERQTTYFLGLPTPAVAIFVVGLFLFYSPTTLLWWLYHPWVLSFLSILLTGLMLVEIPLISLKFQGLQWRGNENKFIFAFSSLLMLVFLQSLGMMVIIVWYVVLSLVEKYWK